MNEHKVYRAIGLMSGTSLDGEVDVALIETDGRDYVKPLHYMAYLYDIKVRDKVRESFGKLERDSNVDEAEKLVTDIHIAAVKAFGEEADIIGFHGQTITHDPDNHFTWQLGDGARLAQETGIDVIADMRANDVKAGGQGAPLLPLYHKALLSQHEIPSVVLNLGGVANITYIGTGGELIAFDCGPANALMDDFMRDRLGAEYDNGGALASKGKAHSHIIKTYLQHSFFKKIPPKSLDRNVWSIDCVRYLSDEDAMATLMEMSVMGVVKAIELLPDRPVHIYVAGGGRKNRFLIDSLHNHLRIPISTIDYIDLNGDAIEAEGFAYLAVRSLLGLHLTLPETTGVASKITGGILHSK